VGNGNVPIIGRGGLFGKENVVPVSVFFAIVKDGENREPHRTARKGGVFTLCKALSTGKFDRGYDEGYRKAKTK
jgi:hypothetical protein